MQKPADTGLARARALLHPAALRAAADDSHGYLDLLGAATAPTPTFAQRAMNNRAVAALYEKAWRPAWVSFTGLTHSAERARAITDLRLDGPQRVLDVACGPGNFTASLGGALVGDGLAIGFDISVPMLTRAVADNSGERVAYIRGDARRLPFADETFDAVCCYGALYLMPAPFTVLDEMIRVVAPGGRIAVMATAQPRLPAAGPVSAAAAQVTGVRTFARDAFTTTFATAGLTDVRQEIRRLVQFVTASKPGR